jgi:transcriptional antiterminator Rof (Rho-off)
MHEPPTESAFRVILQHQYSVTLTTKTGTAPPGNAGEIKRHPEVEALLVARDNRTERMKKVLSSLTEKRTDAPPLLR